MMHFGKIAGRAALGMLAFCLLYAGAALDLSAIPINQLPATRGGVPIYLRSDGGHLDLILPARSPFQDWTQVFPFKNTPAKDPSLSWIGIGWGEKGFYLHPSAASGFPNPITTFRAAAGLSSATLHIAYCSRPVVNDTCRFMYASPAQYQRIVDYVRQSLATDRRGRAQYISAAPDNPCAAFYEAKGTYSIFNTCNTWVNSALKYAGMRACIWTPLARAVLNKYPA